MVRAHTVLTFFQANPYQPGLTRLLRHQPAKVIQVADIPRTKSGKIVELAVRKIVHSEPVLNREALANPEALDLFTDLPELTD